MKDGRAHSVLANGRFDHVLPELLETEVFLMTAENVKHTKQPSSQSAAWRTDAYDPFVRGRFAVGVRTVQALDTVRNRLFP
jgi:hypothetical protein